MVKKDTIDWKKINLKIKRSPWYLLKLIGIIVCVYALLIILAFVVFVFTIPLLIKYFTGVL